MKRLADEAHLEEGDEEGYEVLEEGDELPGSAGSDAIPVPVGAHPMDDDSWLISSAGSDEISVPVPLTHEEHDLGEAASAAANLLTRKWRQQARSAVPNATWFPQPHPGELQGAAEPTSWGATGISGNWAVALMHPERHPEPSSEPGGYVAALLEGQFGSTRRTPRAGPQLSGPYPSSNYRSR